MLDAIYSLQTAPIFAYDGMIDEHTIYSTNISWIWFVIVSIPVVPLVSRKKDYAISCIGIVFYFFRIIPMSSYLKFAPQPLDFIILNTCYWYVLFFFLNIFADKKNTHVYKGNPLYINVIAVAACVTVIIVSGVYAHFRINFSLANVYDLREEARGYNIPVPLSYLYLSVSNILPILVLYYSNQKRRIIVAVLLLIALLNFGVEGSKSGLFKILFVYILSRYQSIDLKKVFAPLFVFLCVASIALYLITDSTVISSFVIRRVFYVPCNLDTVFYDYIKAHNPLYFDSNEFSKLDFTIGEIYFGKEGLRANNGLFTDAYVNLGSIGCIIMPIVVAFFIYVFSKVSNGINKGYIGFASIIIASTLGSTAFTTTLLTHGLFFLVLTLFFLPPEKSTVVSKVDK